MEFKNQSKKNATSAEERAEKYSQETLDEETVEIAFDNGEEQKEKLVQLPMGRVKCIMKSDPDTERVSSDAVFAITKSTELFIQSLVKEAYKYTAQENKKTVQKQDICSAINNTECLNFLDEISK